MSGRRAIAADDERLTGDNASGADGRVVKLGQRRRAKPTTHADIVAKYVAKGIHPLGAKAMADQWAMQSPWNRRAAAKRKETTR